MYNHKYINSATTTVVKSGPGILRSILITGGTKGTVTVYNNTEASGDVVASFDANLVFGPYPLNISMSKGITVVTGSATILTVVY